MRTRKKALGERNIVGAKVEKRRLALGMKQKELLTHMQVKGIDINASALSKLEGQLRIVADYEVKVLSEILSISVTELLGMES